MARTSTAVASAPQTFVTVPGDQHPEVGRTLAGSFGVAAVSTLLAGWLGALAKRGGGA